MISKKLQDYYDSENPWKSIVRPAFLERDNYTCQGCGKTGGELQIHHFDYQHVFHELEYPESCVVLCPSCHRIADRLRKVQKALNEHYTDKRFREGR